MAQNGMEEEENAAEMKLGKIFENQTVLTNTQVSEFLGKMYSARRTLDPNFQLNLVSQKTQSYVERFSTMRNAEAAQKVADMLTDRGMQPFEMGAIANLCPETAEEAKTLVPSLLLPLDEPRFIDEELNAILEDVATYKKFE